MTYSENSREAYRKIIFEGITSKNELLILNYLDSYGSATRNEISRATGLGINQVSGRVSDLIEKGRLENGERVFDSITNGYGAKVYLCRAKKEIKNAA